MIMARDEGYIVFVDFFFFCNEFDVKLEKQELIKGYNYKADTLFVARLIKLGSR